MPWKCCGTSVGVLITDQSRRVLMIQRATHPSGIAPVAGHAADEGQASFQAAAVAEVREEVGLAVTEPDLHGLYHRRLANLCGAQVPANPPGHEWIVYRARSWSGSVELAPDEASGAGWFTPADIQGLAERTVAWADGRMTDAEWNADPGLEPVWVWILDELQMIEVDRPDLLRVFAIAATPPVRA